MAIEDNIPNQINIPGPLTGRHETSNIAPMGFAAFTTNLKSDFAPISVNLFQTRLKSDVSPIPFASFTTAMKSDIAPIAVSQFNPNLKSDVAPIAVSQFNPNLKSDIAPITLSIPEKKSLFEIEIKPLTGRHESSDTVVKTSILGTNNTDSSVAPIISTLTGRFESSDIAPFVPALGTNNTDSSIAPSIVANGSNNTDSNISPSIVANGSNNLTSNTAPVNSVLGANNQTSETAPANSILGANNQTSDISPANSTLGANNQSSDISPTNSTLGANNQSSDTAPINSTLGANNLTSDTAPINSTLGANNTTSDTAPINSTLGANNTTSDTAPANSVLGANNLSSDTAPINSTLGANNQSSNTAPVNSVLGANNQSSDTAPVNSVLGANNQSSDTAPINSVLTGRHDSSDTAPVISTLSGRFETSDTAPQISVLTGRHDSSDTAPLTSVLTGRHDSSDTAPIISILSGRHDSSDTAPIISTLTGRHDSSDTAPIISTLTGRHDSSNIAPIISTLTGRHETSDIDTSFTTDRIAAAFGAGGQDLNDQIAEGINFVDIPNAAAVGFTPGFDVGDSSKFIGVTPQTYDYPDPFGLGQGSIGNSLFTNPYPTPYSTPLFPDGFVENQPIEESQFSLESFAGGGKIGLQTEGFKHATFGGVQGQVPVMGNNPTGLGQFTSGGETSGDIGIVDAFDDTTSGAKGFTPNMFDLGLPKTQFNGVAGTPGSLEYSYPVDVGPAGVGRLMYDVPFSDAGNPFGGEYASSLAEQIPLNPLITVNKGTNTDLVDFDFYNAAPNRLFFNKDNRYEDSLRQFDATIELNGSHPKSILADFAAREHSPSPLDSMKVLIPGNTGPTGESDDTAIYTSMDGYPNYQTQNLTYDAAEVMNQREGFVRTELEARWAEAGGDKGIKYGVFDSVQRGDDGFYFKSDLYGHELGFGGASDDPKGIKNYKIPHILRNSGLRWNGSEDEAPVYDAGYFRGGFVTLGNRALIDVVRNTKHIIDDPVRGLLWGLKQIGLQLSNPKVETELGPLFARPTRIYNLGIGFLANLLTGPFGIKLYRHGVLNGLGSDKGLYEAAVKAHNQPDRFDTPGNYPGKGGGNRLIGLKEDLLLKESQGGGVGGFLGGLLGQEGTEIKPLSDSAFLLGPKSLYGIGGTTIRRYENSHLHPAGMGIEVNDDTNASGGDSNLLAQYAALSYGQIRDAADDRSNSFNDFRPEAYDNGSNLSLFMSNQDQSYYDDMNREVMFGYMKYDENRDRGDFLNDHDLTDPYNFDDFDVDQDYTDEVDTINDGRDMIKLIIEDVQTEKKVRFRSYVSDIVDTITPSWSPVQYVGRPDNVYSYTNTERSINFNLKMAALTRLGMKGMYKKANFLFGLAYPHFRDLGDSHNAIQAPYIKLTMGDYLYKCPGFFDSITVNVDQQSPWEINLENEADVAQLPHFLTVALSFKVVGDGPHTSAIASDSNPDIRGIHIGGGVNKTNAEGKFFENLFIE